MAYSQIKSPNLDPYVYQGGKMLTDWYGWCLAVAWTAFGGRTTNPTAWQGWQSVGYRHTDSPPAGVYVPIWFSGAGGAGHVAIYKDGKVWGSPYTHKPYMDIMSSIAQTEQYYGVKYVGWSEDIGSVRVVQPIETPGGEEIMNQGDVVNMYRALLGRDPDAGGLANYTGKPWRTNIYEIVGSQEYKNRISQIGQGQGQVDQLNAQIIKLNQDIINLSQQDATTKKEKADIEAKVTALSAELDAAQKKLQDLQPNPDDITLNKDSFWTKLKALLSSFTKKG